MRFLHISDVHCTTDYSKIPPLRLGWRRWIAMAELTIGGRASIYKDAPSVLRQYVKDFAAHRADHLLVTGDLTGYAVPDEFQLAKDALSPLSSDPSRCTIIPGNHDTYTPGSKKPPRFDQYFDAVSQSQLPEYVREERYPFVKLLPDTAVVGLLSARVPPVPGLSYGVIGEAQLEGLAAILKDSRLDGKAVLVMVHHAPLGKNGHPDKWHHGLVDMQKLFALLPGPRFAVLHGHIHKRYHHPATASTPHTFGAGSSTAKGHEGCWVIETAGGLVQGGVAYAPGGTKVVMRSAELAPA